MFKKEKNSVLNIGIILILFVLVFYVLKAGSSLITPFIIALLFSFAIIGLSNFYKKIVKFSFISFILSLGTYIFLFWFIGKMIGSNVEDLIRLIPEYQYKVTQIIEKVFEFFKITEFTGINQIIQEIDLQYIFTTTVGGITSIFSSTGLILFYVLFILLEYRFFKDKINLILAGNTNKNDIINIIDKVKSDIKTYFVIKSIVSFGTGVLSYIVMTSFGLDFALFWAVLIFILNFIPNIGSFIAVTFPALLSLIQFDTYYTFVFMTTLLVGVQTLMGSIIEPRFMGNKLNLSPLVIIISLGFWGSIWGIVGMLLSVPIMVIINIILAKIPSTRWIAILLSEKGELQVEGGDEIEKTKRKIIRGLKSKFSKK